MKRIFLLALPLMIAGACPSLSIAEQPEAKETLDLKEQISKNPSDANAHIKLGTIYRKLNRYEESIVEFKEAMRVSPFNDWNYSQLHSEIGESYMGLGKFNEGVAEFKEAIRITPHANAQTRLKNHYQNISSTKKGVPLLEDVVRIYPKDAAAYCFLGEAYRISGSTREAIDSYKKSIQLNLDNAHDILGAAHWGLGSVFNQMKRYEDAIAELRNAIVDYNEIIRISPKDAYMQNTIGNVYASLSGIYALLTRYDEAVVENKKAIDAYNESVRIDPTSSAPRLNLGIIHYNQGNINEKLGKHQEAIAELKEAVRNDDTDERTSELSGQAHASIGTIYFQIKKYQEAIAEFKEAIRLSAKDPDSANSHFNLGLSYHYIKDGSNAIDHLSISARLYEKVGDAARAADAKKIIRDLNAMYGYKPEDSARGKK